MTKRTAEILKRLDETYGTEYICYLNHETPWQLLIAVILSAQCTDARVNIVTETLFKKYDTLEKFANADLAELEEDILCEDTGSGISWRSSVYIGRTYFPCRSWTKDCKCHPGKYLP